MVVGEVRAGEDLEEEKEGKVMLARVGRVKETNGAF